MNAQEPDASPARAGPLRRFGRFALVELLGRSERSMSWHVTDASDQKPRILVLPRSQPPDAAALAQWIQSAQRAARLRHPHLAHALELGHHEGWPFLLYRGLPTQVLSTQLKNLPMPAREAALTCLHLAEALAYAHESGTVHGDLQLYMVLMDDQGRAQLMGLEAACCSQGDEQLQTPSQTKAQSGAAVALAEADRLKLLRAIARRDVLSVGLLLYTLLSNQFPLDEPDTARVIQRMASKAYEAVRLPWNLPQPVPEALRAIVNRAGDRVERQRYAGARTLVHALDGWLRAEGDSAGPLAILLDRLSTVGVLPASPDGAHRAAGLALRERDRTIELAEVVMQDLALSFELLRLVNTAQVRGVQVAGSGPVLTIRRAIALLGLEGVRRAALTLRPWPGPLNEVDALELQRVFARARRAAALAQALRPAHWDAEVVALVTLLQCLGTLVLQYHLPDDSRQMRRLMQPIPPAEAGGKAQPGMSEQAASFAVLGVDVDTVGSAIARVWGFDESVSLLMRRVPMESAVYAPESDDAFLRTLASCAIETIDASAQPASALVAALGRVAQRYARALHFSVDVLKAGLQNARTTLTASAPASFGAAAQAQHVPTAT